MDDIQQLIQTAYTSTDNAARQKAETTLLEGLKDDINLFGKVAALVNASPYRDFAASLLSTVVLQLITQKNRLTIEHARILFCIIESQEPTVKTKMILTKPLISLLKLEKQLKQNVENKMRDLLRTLNLADLNSAIILFKILTDSLELHSYSFTVSSEQNYIWISDFLQLSSYMSQYFVTNPNDLTQERISTTLCYLQVVSDFVEKTFRMKLQNKDSLQPIQNAFLSSNSFNGTLLAILQYFNTSGTQIPNCLISCTGDVNFDNQINELKMLVLRIYMNILQILLNTRNKSEQKRCAFHPHMQANIQLLVYSCLTYVQKYTITQIYEQPHLSQIFTYMMKTLANAGSQTELYSLFSDTRVSFITDLVYPFLITSKKEYNDMQEQPEEFVNLALDTVDKQESDVPKTAAANLLETFCDHIDGSISFLAQLAIITIQASISELSGVQMQLSEGEQEFLKIIKERQLILTLNRKLFQAYRPIDRIESSLMLLTVMSYLIQKRYDIISSMEKLLNDNIQFFLSCQEKIIKVRLALFFGYYCDNLYKSDVQKPNMLKYLQILISYVQPDQPVVLYQGIDSLKDVFEDEDLKHQTTSLVPHLFPPVCAALSYSVYERHFEMIGNLIKNYSDQFLANENLLLSLVTLLTNRILYEQSLVSKGDNTRYIYINRCWNIFRILPEINEYTSLLPKLETQITPLYQPLLNSPEAVDFEEDLMVLVNNMIEKTQSVSQAQIMLLNAFPALVKKRQDRFESLFETLNLYMIYGRHYFLDEKSQKLYFQVAFQNLLSNAEYINEVEQSEGALIIQLGIQILKDDLHYQILEDILKQAVSRLEQIDPQYQKKGKEPALLRSRIAGIILSAFYAIPKTTIQIFQNYVQQTLDTLLQVRYYWGYDIKLFVITICSLINNHTGLLNSQVIQILVQNLNLQQEQEKEQKNNRMEDDNDESFSDEEGDDNECEGEEERQQILIQMEQYRSQLVKLDEFLEFKKLIYAIKQSYPQFIEKLKQDLDPTIQRSLNEILSFTRIENHEGMDPARRIITVKQKKKRTN